MKTNFAVLALLIAAPAFAIKLGEEQFGTNQVSTSLAGTNLVGAHQASANQAGANQVGTNQAGANLVGTERFGQEPLPRLEQTFLLDMSGANQDQKEPHTKMTKEEREAARAARRAEREAAQNAKEPAVASVAPITLVARDFTGSEQIPGSHEKLGTQPVGETKRELSCGSECVDAENVGETKEPTVAPVAPISTVARDFTGSEQIPGSHEKLGTQPVGETKRELSCGSECVDAENVGETKPGEAAKIGETKPLSRATGFAEIKNLGETKPDEAAKAGEQRPGEIAKTNLIEDKLGEKKPGELPLPLGQAQVRENRKLWGYDEEFYYWAKESMGFIKEAPGHDEA